MVSRNILVLAAAVALAGCSAGNGGMWPPQAWPVELRSEEQQTQAAAQAAQTQQAAQAQQTQQQAQQAWQAQQWQAQQAQQAWQGPQAPPPRAPLSIRERMRELKALYLEQLITPAEYEAKKAAVLGDL